MSSAVTIGLAVGPAALAAIAAGVAGYRAGRTRRAEDRSSLAEANREMTSARAQATTADRSLIDALEGFPHGVVLFHQDGTVQLANSQGRCFVQPRVEDALVAAAMRELVAAAGPATGRLRRTVTLSGPPAHAFEISVGWPRPESHGALAIVEDVTNRYRLEQMRSDFVANISHELRTPIGAMALLAETLADDDDPATMVRLARHIHDEAMRVAQTVNDLQSLSLIEGEAVETDTVSIGEAVDAAIERVAGQAAASTITIVRHLPTDDAGDERDAGPTVPANFGQLVSAVANLVDNAIKYSAAGDSVRIDVSEDADAVHIKVSDNGIGIPTRDLERIFERFYRVDRARSRRTGGTGLGLAIVRHVATNHGGQVAVASVEGEGSTFTLSLPRS